MSEPKPKPVANKRKRRVDLPAGGGGADGTDHRSKRTKWETDVVRLTDARLQPVLRELIAKATATPESARDYLVRLGTLTKAGNLTRKYGGK
ncbi:MAG: hypothetical protein M3R60_05475 [Pseudomonadota bacterium]|nr:hypothetical protein [Pseudomonadota bacterium]